MRHMNVSREKLAAKAAKSQEVLPRSRRTTLAGRARGPATICRSMCGARKSCFALLMVCARLHP